MGAVLEDVAHRHGGRAEAVDEQGFEFAFEEVESYEGEGEGLEVGWSGAVGEVGEDGVEEGVDEEGTGIFDKEDGLPCYLWTCRGERGTVSGLD